MHACGAVPVSRYEVPLSSSEAWGACLHKERKRDTSIGVRKWAATTKAACAKIKEREERKSTDPP
jgi:hypothetical protein